MSQGVIVGTAMRSDGGGGGGGGGGGMVSLVGWMYSGGLVESGAVMEVVPLLMALALSCARMGLFCRYVCVSSLGRLAWTALALVCTEKPHRLGHNTHNEQNFP